MNIAFTTQVSDDLAEIAAAITNGGSYAIERLTAEQMSHRSGGKLHASSVLKSAQSNGPKQAPKRDDIVADLAKADGIVPRLGSTSRGECSLAAF